MLRGLIKPFFPVAQSHLYFSRRYLFIASIGNPEPQYANTRHNAGHRLMNQLIDVYWKDHLYKKGLYYLSTKYPNLVLFKSNDSLMNLQGLPISKHFTKQGYGKSALVILHDELQIHLGKYQIRKPGTSSRGHNGLKSIDKYLKNKYFKFGIGIGRPPASQSVVQYVLNEFSVEDLKVIDWKVLPKCVKDLENMVIQDLKSQSGKDRVNDL
ncbi:peptidyl-tRNA hydrolase, putative [Candida dubliniensis CD36]|uniref:Peptidyl-tRNA hydrolase n=1 Tax=Candida dubliniensis (strain CD36 / ATCC MYA-646 / CBS 7987 / NCPF 3949 / NRRL Y-17841) TaxID=573826 RepID=B9W8Q8_CANDC|nr:peptidyl-tRNA hydrolase, putative [Candida dubliniensis CD36]CAX45131.1 peptidyl-tRNA hydrolase, putative [Candida dubliniensis CD36]